MTFYVEKSVTLARSGFALGYDYPPQNPNAHNSLELCCVSNLQREKGKEEEEANKPEFGATLYTHSYSFTNTGFKIKLCSNNLKFIYLFLEADFSESILWETEIMVLSPRLY